MKQVQEDKRRDSWAENRLMRLEPFPSTHDIKILILDRATSSHSDPNGDVFELFESFIVKDRWSLKPGNQIHRLRLVRLADYTYGLG